MSILNMVEVPKERMPIITIHGDAGTGKTTLASTFEDCVFIRVEDGMQAIPIDKRPPSFPVVDKFEEMINQLTALIKEDHNYKWLVIDSVTELEKMLVGEVVEADIKADSINQAAGGFGNGWATVSAFHGRVRKAVKILNEQGMGVIFIAHSEVGTIDPPDGESYSRYQLRLNKKCITHYTDNVDMVAFIKLQTFMKGESGKAITSGQRVLVCEASASNVSKNRYGITSEINVENGVNPLKEIIKGIA